jgi:hypothetical protein
MKTLVFILTIILSVGKLFSQNYWIQSNYFPNSNAIYIQSIAKDYGGWERIVVGGYGSCGCVFSSDNLSGQTWQNISSPPTSVGSVIDMAIAPWSFIVFAAVNNSSGSGALYRYKSGSWSQVGNLGGQDVRTVLAHGYLFAGVSGNSNYRGVWKSTNDDGSTWTRNMETASYEIYCMDTKNDIFYAGGYYTNAGSGILLQSTNSGSNWSELGSFTNHIIGVTATDSNDVYIVTTQISSHNIWRKLFNGGWEQLQNAPDIQFDILKAPIVSNKLGHIFVGDYNYGGVYRSTDKGNTWEQINSGLLQTRISDLRINQNNQKIYASHIQGLSFNINISKYSTAAPILPPQLASPMNGSDSIAINDTLKWNNVNIATSYHLQISTDSLFGSFVLDSAGITSLSFVIPNRILTYNTFYYWRVAGSNNYGDGPYSVIWHFRTENYISPPPPQLLSPGCGTVIPTLTPLLQWSDISQTAINFHLQLATDNDFTNLLIDSIGLPDSQYQVSSGLLQGEIWYFWRVNAKNEQGIESEWSEICTFKPSPNAVNEVKNASNKDFKFLNNYPNPFNPTTAIKFSLPTSEYVTLKVYNIIGIELTTLINGTFMAAGQHSIIFKANNLESNTYFCRLQAGKFVDVKKIVLIK